MHFGESILFDLASLRLNSRIYSLAPGQSETSDEGRHEAPLPHRRMIISMINLSHLSLSESRNLHQRRAEIMELSLTCEAMLNMRKRPIH